MNWSDQIALVTGASRGLGAAIADELARRGTYVIGTATSASGAEAIGQRLQAAGLPGEGRVLALGGGDGEADIEALLSAIGKDHGAPSILINNAGITRDTLLMRMKAADWDQVLDVNLRSVFLLSRACLKGMMKARYGRMVNLASVVGVSGNPGQVNYAAAKAGLIGLSKSLAREVGSRGITVNVVAPGFIDTDMTRALDDAQRAALLGNIPLARLGQPEEVAAAVAFLASPEAGYITGETLHVNGGMYMA